MSAGVRRTVAWAVGVLCLAVIAALLVLAMLDLDIADGTASVVAAVVAVIGLALSVITLLVTPVSGGGQAMSTVVVRARGRRALGVGGDMRGSAVGDRSKVRGPASPPAPPARPPGAPVRRDVSARGEGAMGVGGDATDNAIGEDSER